MIHPRLIPLLLAALLTLALPGCSVGGSAELTSADNAAQLTGDFPLIAYTSTGNNAADIYLTDLPREHLDAGVPFARLRGQIVHIRLFTAPKPGKTSIDVDATNATVRHYIFAAGDAAPDTEPRIGVYEGAGFLLPRGAPGGPWFGASMKDGSVALLRATDGFRDLLGPSRASYRFRAPEDPGLGRVIAYRLRAALELCSEIDPPEIQIPGSGQGSGQGSGPGAGTQN